MRAEPVSLRRVLVFAVAAAALVTAVAFVDPVPAGAASSTFVATADASVDSSHPNTNYGTTSSLATAGSPEVRSYLRFSISGLTGSVARATLLVYATSPGTGLQVRQASNATWSELKIYYSNAPAVGPVLATSGSFAAGTWVSLDVTPFVTGNGVVGPALTSTGSNTTYASRETGATAPKLVVETSTPSPSPSPTVTKGDPKIATAGDIACDPADANYNGGNGTASECRQLYTSNLVYSHGYAGVLLLGDNQYESGTRSQYDASYNVSWGRVKSITHPAPGNHEYNTSGAAGYFSYFAAAAGDPTKGYYSYNVGSWHFIALNSNCASVSCAAGSVQENWLRSDLQAHQNTCTVAYWHHPRFSSGPSGSNTTYTAFWQALYDFNADLVLVGHDHDYERFAPQTPAGAADPTRGIREFVVGTGGRSHHSFSTIKPNSEVHDATAYGILELTLHAAGYNWRFIPEAGGTFTDSGSGVCH